MYESILGEQFQIPEDDGTDLVHMFFNPDREGWLWKQGSIERIALRTIVDVGANKINSWRRRWFIISDNCLYYFESPSVSAHCLGIHSNQYTLSIAQRAEEYNPVGEFGRERGAGQATRQLL